MAQRRVRKKAKIHWFLKLLILVILVLCISKLVPEISKKQVYPMEYGELVSTYSTQYNIDTNFVYAVIKTESGFIEKAESDVGARGLMQIMEIAYDWVNFKINDERDISYDQMYEAEYNIEYGSFMLGYYYEKYDSYELAAAAYHSGMGAVDGWLSDGTLDIDNLVISDIPSKKTTHYIKKVMEAFDAYNNLYGA